MNTPRPRLACVLLLIGGLLTGYFGLSANGYLVPAVTLLITSALLWLGRARALVRWIALLNMGAGLLLVLVLAFGGFLGDHKLDVSAVALLANLLAGGPMMSLAGLVVLGATRKPLTA